MNPAFLTFLSAAADDRRDAFIGAARRLDTAEQNVEKDFWVCWTLDALFNGGDADGPRLLFKGGTSLSKAFGLISRFSEDIDITIFRDDLGQGASVGDLEALSGKKRRARLDAIKAASQTHVTSTMRSQVAARLRATMHAAGLSPTAARVEPDPDDQDERPLDHQRRQQRAGSGRRTGMRGRQPEVQREQRGLGDQPRRHQRDCHPHDGLGTNQAGQ